MDKLKLIGLNLGQVFNYRCGHASGQISARSSSKQPNLELKTRPKPFLCSLPLAFTLSTGIIITTLHFLLNLSLFPGLTVGVPGQYMRCCCGVEDFVHQRDKTVHPILFNFSILGVRFGKFILVSSNFSKILD